MDGTEHATDRLVRAAGLGSGIGLRVAGSLIHILLVVAPLVLTLNLLQGRRVDYNGASILMQHDAFI